MAILNFVPADELIEEWRKGTLESNVLDHPVSDATLVPSVLKRYCSLAAADMDELCDYTLTREGWWTDFHCDGEVGKGGWMFLYEGQKMWWMVEPDMNILYAEFCGPGDFIYFPIKWRHAVRTIEKTFGLTGYL